MTMELAIEEYEDFMLDLETLDTTPGAVVLSIGGVLFDRKTKSIGPGISVALDIDEQLARGHTVSGGTLAFWFKQNDEARSRVLANQRNVVDVLMGLAEFLTHGEGGANGDMRVWGNGAGFDNPILQRLYATFGMAVPWKHWNDRCFRTLKNEHADRKGMEPVFDGEKHDAYHDAKHQAKWAINMYHNERVFNKPETDQMDLLTDGEA
jgi:hypothetical protein